LRCQLITPIPSKRCNVDIKEQLKETSEREWRYILYTIDIKARKTKVDSYDIQKHVNTSN